MADPARQAELTSHAQRRQTARDLVDYDTIIIRPGNVRRDVQLVDISPKGFHARCGLERFERGESVSLRLPLIGLVQGRVMWSLRGCFGGQFILPVDARAYLDCLVLLRAGTGKPRD